MWSNYYNSPMAIGMCCRCPYFAYCSMINSGMHHDSSYKGGIYARHKNKRKAEKDVDFFYRQKQFTIEELAQYDGSGGKPAYVAVNGIVYDVSMNQAWGGGSHFGQTAGKDLSAEYQSCHGMNGVLQKLPKVGVLK